MKKTLFLVAVMLFFSVSSIYSQDEGGSQTSEGSWLIEANTGNAMLGSTSFMFASSDGVTQYNLGLDGGYFIIDDLAVKAGLGFGGVSWENDGSASAFSYRIGAKYYIIGQIPVTLDLTGATGDAVEIFGETPLWLGLGGGYAWFVSNTVSIEPGLRYNISLNDQYTDKGIFQINIGFALHF